MATLAATSKYILDGVFTGSGALNNPAVPMVVTKPQTWANGTSDNQANQFWQVSTNANATPTVYDLDSGALLDDFGTALVFATIVEILIINKSTSTGEVLTLAGDFLATVVWSGTTPTHKLHPSGRYNITAPIDPYTVAAGTGDQISIDPGANNVAFDLILIGTV